MCDANRRILNFFKIKFESNKNSEYRKIIILLSLLLFIPLAGCIFHTIYLIIYQNSADISFANRTSIEDFFKANFFSFVWYEGWLSALYNFTAIIGVAFAAMTYHKNNKSQASINHFSNVQLFRDYVQQEISKTNRLAPASFDLMSWYSIIYPQSKQGVIICSPEYKSLMNEYDLLIKSSNLAAKNNQGFKYLQHQSLAKKIFFKLGINIKETNRIGYFEVEEEIILLIEKTNATFPSEAQINIFTKRSYK